MTSHVTAGRVTDRIPQTRRTGRPDTVHLAVYGTPPDFLALLGDEGLQRGPAGSEQELASEWRIDGLAAAARSMTWSRQRQWLRPAGGSRPYTASETSWPLTVAARRVRFMVSPGRGSVPVGHAWQQIVVKQTVRRPLTGHTEVGGVATERTTQAHHGTPNQPVAHPP